MRIIYIAFTILFLGGCGFIHPGTQYCPESLESNSTQSSHLFLDSWASLLPPDADARHFELFNAKIDGKTVNHSHIILAPGKHRVEALYDPNTEDLFGFKKIDLDINLRPNQTAYLSRLYFDIPKRIADGTMKYQPPWGEKNEGMRYPDSDTLPPLVLETLNGDIDMVRTLLKTGEEPDVSGPKGFTPLMAAVANKDREMIEFLIENGADLNFLTNEGSLSALHFAIKKGYSDMVAFLINKGVDINLQSPDNFAPIHTAIIESQNDILKLLINKGADVIMSVQGKTPLEIAEEHRNQMAAALIKADFSYQMYMAIAENDIMRINELLGLISNINKKDCKKRTFLYYAKSKEAVKLLLRNGIDINSVDKYGYTALYMAIRKDNMMIAETLLDEGAGVNLQDNKGHSVIHMAFKKKNIPLVKTLLDADADVNLKDKHGRSYLHYAKDNYTIRLLMDRKVDVRSFFLSAVEAADHKFVTKMIKYGLEVNNPFGAKALLLAAKKARWTKKCVVQDRNKNKIRGYVFVSTEEIRRRHMSIIRQLIHAGADPYGASLSGYIPTSFKYETLSVRGEPYHSCIESGSEGTVVAGKNAGPTSFELAEEYKDLELINALKGR